jgi:putative addiction module component (TIGR02574 family)
MPSTFDIEQMSVSECLELIGRLWDSIPESELAIPEWHRQELERRLAAADAEPDAGIPWKEVRTRLRENNEAPAPI